jgi:hypothetical protein
MKLSNSRDLAIYMAYFANAGGGGVDNYSDVYDAFTNKPNAATKAAQQAFVNSLTSAGVWAKLDGLWVFATHSNDDGEALINWVDPTGTAATAVNSPTFTQYEGMAGNGSTSYINLQYNPSSDGSNFVQDSASFGFYSNTDVNESSWDMGARDNVNGWTQGAARNGGDSIYRVNCLTSESWVSANSEGMFSFTRENATTIAINKNGTELDDNLNNSTGLPNYDMYICGRNNNGSPDQYTTRQYGMAFVGGFLTESELGNFYSAYNTYKTAITPAAASSYMEDSEGNRVKDSEGNDIIIP